MIVFSDFLAKQLPKIAVRLLSTVAYASMAMYLFHRHVYTAELKVFEMMDISVNYWLCYLVLLPSAFIAGCFIQKIYDGLIDRLSKNR